MYATMPLVACARLFDLLWCLWDPERQCLHDKMVDVHHRHLRITDARKQGIAS